MTPLPLHRPQPNPLPIPLPQLPHRLLVLHVRNPIPTPVLDLVVRQHLRNVLLALAGGAAGAARGAEGGEFVRVAGEPGCDVGADEG